MSAPTCLDCQVLPPFSIILCPLHAHAHEMLFALERVAAIDPGDDGDLTNVPDDIIEAIDAARAIVAKVQR